MTANSSLPIFGVITAIPYLELPAVLRAFDIDDKRPTDKINDYPVWQTRIYDTNNKAIHVIISSATESGNIAIVPLTYEIVKTYKPQVMFLVGIACGIRDYCPTDVIVSKSVWAYEYIKLQDSGTLDRARFITPNDNLLNRFHFFNSHTQWHERFVAKLQSETKFNPPRAIIRNPGYQGAVMIASGEKIIANGELSRLNAKHDLIRAGEMEAYGFAKACTSSRPPPPWLVIRGVSDYGDASKDLPDAPKSLQPDPTLGTNHKPSTQIIDWNQFKAKQIEPSKDEYHYPAALSAACFLRTFLEAEPWSDLTTSDSPHVNSGAVRENQIVRSTDTYLPFLNNIRFEIDEWESVTVSDIRQSRLRFFRLLQGVMNLTRHYYEHRNVEFIDTNIMFLRTATDKQEWLVSLDDGIIQNPLETTLSVVLTSVKAHFVNDFEYVEHYPFIKKDFINEYGDRKRIGLNGRTVRELFDIRFRKGKTKPLIHPLTVREIRERTQLYTGTASIDGGVYDNKFALGIRFTGDFKLIYSVKKKEGYVEPPQGVFDKYLRSIINIPIFSSDERGRVKHVLGTCNINFGIPIIYSDELAEFPTEIQSILNRSLGCLLRDYRASGVRFDQFDYSPDHD